MELMGPKLLAETADMIGIKELKDAFREVGGHSGDPGSGSSARFKGPPLISLPSSTPTETAP